jgi:hypothetical protein
MPESQPSPDFWHYDSDGGARPQIKSNGHVILGVRGKIKELYLSTLPTTI